MEIGYTEGDLCARKSCSGVIEQHPAEGCLCHINPPCSACTDPRGFCPSCGWEESEDEIEYVPTPGNPKYRAIPEQYRARTITDLDGSKLDWISRSHTNASMIKEGVYPEGMSQDDVKKRVDGTFGGRFNRFGGGRFEFVAYTD